MIGSTSYLDGGFLYINDDTDSKQVKVELQGTTTLNNLKSLGNGGGIYLKAVQA